MRPGSFQSTTFSRSLAHAWNGLLHTVVHQRNMRIHLIAAVLVGQVGSGLPLGLAEKVTLIFCVLLVLFAEMLNSALEQLVDLATEQLDERARLTKDIAAACVLVLALGTVVIFAAILVHEAPVVLGSLELVQKQVWVGVPLTLAAGTLMHETPRPLALDLLTGAIALGLWGYSLSWTESYVFSGLTLAFLGLAMSASFERRRARGAGEEKQNPAPGRVP
jgi:diacylglycerol kinase (ATP)